MAGFLTNLGAAFILGLLTPLTAVCVLPLYPGFLAFLAGKLSQKNNKISSPHKKQFAMLGVLVTMGVILFMFLLGLIFTSFLQMSLTKVIGIISPFAFAILAISSILLIFDIDLSRFLPKPKTPQVDNPKLNALLVGFFFGAIVVPCNPAFIAAFFTQVILSASDPANIFNFISFGAGIGAPLLLFSLISAKASGSIIRFIIRYKRQINLIAGIIMLAVSLYYLLCVFQVFNGANICGYLGAFTRG